MLEGREGESIRGVGVEGKSEEEIARRLSITAGATRDWARENGVAFDKAKTEKSRNIKAISISVVVR